MKLRILLTAVCLFAANDLPAQSPPAASTPAATTFNVDPSIIAELQGVWKNQLGSTLDIKQIDAATGQITGTYKSPTGTSGQEFPVLGWVIHSTPAAGKDNAVVVSFSVRWGLTVASPPGTAATSSRTESRPSWGSGCSCVRTAIFPGTTL